ncbi:hypothetical protein Avbf_18991 [Armadillidium vulgare]|nr:hypothetical protein Avbf_18991 [Armadillidium vulgare]
MLLKKNLNGIVYLLNNKDQENCALEPENSPDGGTNIIRNVKEGVVCNRDYRCVMRGKLGPHNLLFSASMDCFNPDICDLESLDPSTSVLLKCSFDNPESNSLESYVLTFSKYFIINFKEFLLG